MISLLLRLVFVLLFFVAIAPEVHAQRSLHGKIIDTSGIPLPNAIVTAQKAIDGSPIQTSFSDARGQYSIWLPDTGALIIKIAANGFKPQQINVSDTAGALEKSFVLVAGQELGLVTVSGARPLIERKLDRIVFNVSASIAAIGGTALDMVKKSPGVLVSSQENSISLAGKSQVLVMVNDELIQLSGEDLTAYLQSIPSDNIDRIEVITTPPAKYDAAGSTGLLNIILKKKKTPGLNAELRAGYEQSGYATGIAGANVSYKKGGLSLFGNLSYSKGSKNIIETMRSEFTNQTYALTEPYKKTIRNAQYTLGGDYELSKKSAISLQLTGTDFRRMDQAII